MELKLNLEAAERLLIILKANYFKAPDERAELQSEILKLQSQVETLKERAKNANQD